MCARRTIKKREMLEIVEGRKGLCLTQDEAITTFKHAKRESLLSKSKSRRKRGGAGKRKRFSWHKAQAMAHRYCNHVSSFDIVVQDICTCNIEVSEMQCNHELLTFTDPADHDASRTSLTLVDHASCLSTTVATTPMLTDPLRTMSTLNDPRTILGHCIPHGESGKTRIAVIL
jgi:hypothetical protein